MEVADSKPRVLMVTGEYPPAVGGVGDYTARLAHHLDLAGARVAVVTREAIGLPARINDHGRCCTLRTVPHWGFGSWPSLVREAIRWRPRIVHIQYQAAAYAMNPAVNLLPAYFRLRLPAVRVVTTFHDLRVPYLFPKAGRLRWSALRAMDALSHAVVVTDGAALSELAGPSLIPARPLRRVIPIGSNVGYGQPAGYDRVAWRERLGFGNMALVLSYFGFMNDSKGVEFLVEALGSLLQWGIDARLLIVGGDAGETDPTNRAYRQRVLRAIESLRIGDRVRWTGFVPPEEVSASLLASDLCALPFRDGASFKRGSLLAALALGLPVVTTEPMQREPLLVDGENVATVARDDAMALAEAIARLWRNGAARARLSNGARQLASRFSWEEITTRHMELYRQLLREGGDEWRN